MSLDALSILGKEDLRTETVFIPEWSGEVKVKTMDGKERDAFEQRVADERKATGHASVRAHLAASTLVGDDGSLLFSPADVAKLGAKSAAALDRIFDVAARLNRLTKEDAEKLEKNS